MQRIFRGVLRFSSGGFTNLRIARRLSASAPSETSAQTGRLTSLPELFFTLAMALPKNPVYAITPSLADSHFGCRENDNPQLRCKQRALPIRLRNISIELGPLPIFDLTALSLRNKLFVGKTFYCGSPRLPFCFWAPAAGLEANSIPS